MIKGLYSAASAMVAGLARQNVISHNLSNVDTPGFKQMLLGLDDFLYSGVYQRPDLNPDATRLKGIGDLGLGVDVEPTSTDFSSGALRQTDQPLDLGLQGGGFFRVRTPEGERYTRDGRFQRDVNGLLVTIDGYPVLSSTGATITIPDGVIGVSSDGAITADGQAVAQLGLAAFLDPQAELTRDRPNTFAAAGGPTGTDVGTVHQGYLEMANTNPAQLMTQLVSVGRAYEAAQRLVQIQDDLLGRAITSLGRI